MKKKTSGEERVHVDSQMVDVDGVCDLIGPKSIHESV